MTSCDSRSSSLPGSASMAARNSERAASGQPVRLQGTPRGALSDDAQRSIDAFEALLREKAGLGDEAQPHRDPPAPLLAGECDAGAATPPPLAPVLTKASDTYAALSPLRGAVDPPSALARIEHLSATPAAADAACAFEVALNEPLGIAMSLRAVRPEAAAHAGAPAGWTLSIGSSSLNPAVLQRYSGRLDERLRSRALAHQRVRIEYDEPPE